jgi:hypothetical protein
MFCVSFSPEAVQLLASFGVPDAHCCVTAAADDLTAISIVAHILQGSSSQTLTNKTSTSTSTAVCTETTKGGANTNIKIGARQYVTVQVKHALVANQGAVRSNTVNMLMYADLRCITSPARSWYVL